MKNKAILSSLAVDFTLICLLIGVLISHSKQVIALLCSIAFVLMIISWKNHGKNYMSFSFFFFVLLYVFHCGYCLLWVFDFNFTNLDILILIDDLGWCNTIKFAFSFIYLCYIGIISAKKPSIPIEIKYRKKYFDVKKLKKIGTIFVILFFIPRVYIDLAYIIAGYNNAFDLSINGFIETFAEGFFIGLMLIMIGSEDNRQLKRNTLVVGLLFCLIGMLSGRRQEKVVFALGLLFIYFDGFSYEKNQRTKFLASAVLGFLLLAFIATIGDLRAGGTISIQDFMTTFFKNLGYKMLFEQIQEFGYASYTLAATMQSYPWYGEGHGWNYFATLVEVLPNIGGAFSGIINELSFVNKIPTKYYFWLGGSILGEFYYNFGFFGLIFAIPLGRIVNSISNSITFTNHRRIANNMTLLSVILVGPMFLWIRGSFAYIVRTGVWLFVLSLMLKRVKVRNWGG